MLSENCLYCWLSQQIGILSRLKNLVPVLAKLTLFKSAILSPPPPPLLMYCQKVWHFARASNKCKLERIQETDSLAHPLFPGVARATLVGSSSTCGVCCYHPYYHVPIYRVHPTTLVPFTARWLSTLLCTYVSV